MELEEKEFELTKVYEDVVELFYPVGLKMEVDVIFDLQVIKFSQVKGDEGRLKQILLNILSNAMKFSLEGNVTKVMDEVHHHHHDDPNSMEFVFEVNDTGKGIPKAKQASIFENYVQVKEMENETTPEIEGTGLGLGIVQSLVQLMRGEISIVDKEVGEKGTCFKFNVVFKVYIFDLSEDYKAMKIYSPKQGYNSSIVVLFISRDERVKMAQNFIKA
ncbi:unnamed protein product [Lactuca saligna]|uniref:histidine kinase n=1 Tax=Lactuca saligna TaxID=75948 RepID=A0AA35VHJ0_LACSI|nr:unnamed protein product [Lactuca saligna]